MRQLPLNPSTLFPKASILPFASFNNQYAGRSCYVVGRGPTRFPFAKLAAISDPIFFINDAVCAEGHARSDTFFFAHDTRMRVWLNGAIRATAVLPLDGKLFLEQPVAPLNHDGNVVFYKWCAGDAEPLLELNKDQLSTCAQLYRHSATIHSLLHFVWFCGFRQVAFIGCDGLNDPELLGGAYHAPAGYDPRLENRSRTVPWWQYQAIRQVQDALCARLGLETRFVGTPYPHGFAAGKRFIRFNPREPRPKSAPLA